MRYQLIAVNFLLVSTALLWTGVLCAEQAVLQTVQESSLNMEPMSLSKRSSFSSDLNVEFLLACMCKYYGPVHFNTLDRKMAIKILIVLVILSRVFESLMYVGTIEVDEVLAYYPLLSELSHVKKWHPEKLEQMLVNWPLPKGNLTLSLLISTGQINSGTPYCLASYLPRVSGKSARLAAVNYYLDACTSKLMPLALPAELVHCREILHSAFEPYVVRKLKRILRPSEMRTNFIASSLLHFASAKLDTALVNVLNDALAEIKADGSLDLLCGFYLEFAEYPVILQDPESMQAIFERNARVFQILPFSDEQRTDLSALNKIKFGSSRDIMDMNLQEREALLRHFGYQGTEWLVLHVWAREDVEKDGAWAQLANDPSNTRTLSRLAFDLEGFFQNFDLANLNRFEFEYVLVAFKYRPISSKMKRFHELLRAKVHERSETMLAPFRTLLSFKYLVNFFIDQGDKEGPMALNDLAYKAVDGVPSAVLLDGPVSFWELVHVCQLLGGRIDGGCINDPLQLLAQRVGAAKVLRYLDFSLLRAYDVEGILSTLGISREQMDKALSSLGHEAKPKDELAAVLWQFHKKDRNMSLEILPIYHALWFYLCKEHREAFGKHVDLNLQRHYLLAMPRPLIRARRWRRDPPYILARSTDYDGKVLFVWHMK